MKRQTARVGQEFPVSLPPVPATGHQWELQTGGEHVEVVRRETSEASPEIGGAAAEELVLRPKKAGEFVLQFGLKRPWEAEVAETATVEVSVADPSKEKSPKQKRAAPATKKPAIKKSAKRAR
jgi:predicted secreted protein